MKCSLMESEMTLLGEFIDLSERIKKEIKVNDELSNIIKRLIVLVETDQLDSFQFSITDAKEFFFLTGKINVTVFLKEQSGVCLEKALLGKKLMSVSDKVKESMVLGSNFASKASSSLKSELVLISDNIAVINDLLSLQLKPSSEKFYFSKKENKLPDFLEI